MTSHLGTGSAEDKILLIGQSLGTGVVAGLAGQLALDRPLILCAHVDGTRCIRKLNENVYDQTRSRELWY